MARPKSDNYDQIKTDILDAAAALFAQKGFLNTNIVEIGVACNASKSRMYHYYPSKEVMLAEMLSEHVLGLIEVAEAAISTEAPPEKKFALYVRAHLDYYFSDPARHAVLLHDSGYLPKEPGAALDKQKHRLIEMLSTLLHDINPRRIRTGPTATAHAMLIYGMLNWTYTWYNPDGPVKRSQLADYATRLCLEGLST